MARVTGIGGAFGKASDAVALAAWAPRVPSTSGRGVGRRVVNYRVDDLDGMLDQLRSAGAAVDGDAFEGMNGRFGH